jgi:hypothetical protein
MAEEKTVRLNKYNPSVTLPEKHGHETVRILKMVPTRGSARDLASTSSLRLEVIDQHGLPLFSKPLSDFQQEQADRQEIRVNEQFAVRDHLTIRLASDEEKPDFEVDVHFE